MYIYRCMQVIRVCRHFRLFFTCSRLLHLGRVRRRVCDDVSVCQSCHCPEKFLRNATSRLRESKRVYMNRITATRHTHPSTRSHMFVTFVSDTNRSKQHFHLSSVADANQKVSIVKPRSVYPACVNSILSINDVCFQASDSFDL